MIILVSRKKGEKFLEEIFALIQNFDVKKEKDEQRISRNTYKRIRQWYLSVWLDESSRIL